MQVCVCVCVCVCVSGLEGVEVGQNLSPRDEGYNEIFASI